ncbi:MAG: efflux RND transporter permease subunit [Nitrospinae bacterium]|nr:efflux RND transporter permease subunit [Nitrospinota bacterium]
MWLTRLALKNYVAVYTLIVFLVIVGTYSYVTLPREASPDITIPMVIVSTPYAGVSPADMESLVTNEIEKELKNLANVEEMRSSSKEGMSVISVKFDPSVDIDAAIQKVRDKVNIAKPNLPADADEPMVQEINFSNFPIMIVNLSGEYGLVRLKQIAENLQDKMEAIPGVLEVALAGGLSREVQVDLDPERLLYYGLSIKDVVDVITKENVTIPGGAIDIGDYKYLVRVPGEFKDPMIIRDLVVKSDARRPIYMRDIAEVRFGFADVATVARLNGTDTISLSVKKRSGENIIEVTDAVKALLEEEIPQLPRSTAYTITADQSKDTRNLLKDLENNVITGFILVVGVLFFFLGLKVAVFVALSIPLSMLLSFFLFKVMGYSLNMVVLFSLILALGMLVDNAIVVVENIFRHMEEGRDPMDATLVGTGEVMGAIFYSTLTTLCAFFPMMFWPGIMGEFMFYLPMTVIVTLSSSLFVAVVINPTLCATLLRPSRTVRVAVAERADEHLSVFMRRYKAFLTYALAKSGRVFGAAVASLVAIMFLYGAFGNGVEFFPALDPNTIFVNIEAPTGARVEMTDKMAQVAESFIPAYPDVKSYVTNVGVSTDMFDMSAGEGPGHKARVAVDFIDREERSRPSTEVEAELREKIKEAIVGASVKIEAQENGPPTGAPVNIEISGRDYAVLARIAAEVEGLLKATEGLVDVKNDYSAGKPELRIDIDREQAARYGLRTVDVASYIRSAIYGAKASTYREGEDEYDIRVRFRADRRDQVEELASFFIRHEEKVVPLTSLAKVTTASGYSDIAHIDRKKVITVSSDVAPGYNANERLATVREAAAALKLPEGYLIDYTGANKEQKESETFLTEAFMGAALLITFALILEFNSIVTPLVIMSGVVLSLIGVMVGLLVTGTPFGVIMTGMGVISLAGVVVNNSIVLLDYTIQLRQKGMSRTEAIIVAGMTRTRPVLLTAVTAMLGLLPIMLKVSFDFLEMRWVFDSEMAGWWGPMATAVVYGLGFATALTLVVTPTLYKMLDTLVHRITGRSLAGDAPEDHATP